MFAGDAFMEIRIERDLGHSGTLRGSLVVGLLFSLVCCGPARSPLPPSARASFEGTVIGVDNRTPAQQMAEGIRVTLRPEGQPLVVVDLAPGWYLNQQGLHFSERDRLSVEAATNAGDPVVRAQSVSKGSLRVPLRDPAGKPVWDTSKPRPDPAAPGSAP